ncbi:MAG: alpha/beta hydrolase family protein [Actinomycetota bacterium]
MDVFDTLLRLHGAEALGREYVFVRLARMNIAGHIDYSETSRILQAIRKRSDWLPAWMQASARHERLASSALARDATTSAGDGFLRASLCAHWATLFAQPEEKTDAHRRSLELYRLGSIHFDPPAERVEVPFDGDVLPGYLRVPRDAPRPKVVLMLGGADTNKEELHHWGTEFCRRGLAVLPFDGPGQGELAARYGRLPLRLGDFHRAVTAVVDWLTANRPDLDHEGVGVFGNSLGGYLALDAALRDERVGAVICNGGFFDGRSLDTWPEGVLRAFSSCTGLDLVAVRSHVREELDLRKAPGHHRPPALIVHGGREDLSDEDELRDAAILMQGLFAVVEDGWHTCTNRDHLVSPLFADWMRESLLGLNEGRGHRELRLADESDYGLAIDA